MRTNQQRNNGDFSICTFDITFTFCLYVRFCRFFPGSSATDAGQIAYNRCGLFAWLGMSSFSRIGKMSYSQTNYF